MEQYLSEIRRLNKLHPLEESNETMWLDERIFHFFRDNPNPSDQQVHLLAKQIGINEHKFEEAVYKLISEFAGAGYSKGKNKGLDEEELRMGIEVEMEHTSNPVISRKIAYDHLTEIPDYYTRLAKMEKEAKKELG